MLGATALIPILVVPAMGGTPKQMAEAREFGPCPAREMTQVSTPHRSSAAREKERGSLVPSRFIQAGGILVRARSIPARPPAARRQVICTIFFVSGCNTLLQTTIGDRLPIVQGGSFAFLSPTFAIANQVRAMVAAGEIDPSDQFEATMRRIQGAVLVVGLTQVALGYSGALGLLTRFISPLTIAPTVCMVGLGLYTAPNINGNFQRPLPVPGCEGYAAAVIICMVVFSQLLGFVNLKIGGASIKIFALFPVLWTVMVAWGIGAIAQAAGGMDDDYLGGRYAICKTSSQVIEDSKWFRWPYPGQWGAPIFDKCAILPMIAAMLVSMVESIGDYYAAAQLAGAPPPSGPVISRGLAGEGRVC